MCRPAPAKTILERRLAELYPLLHAARFGQSLWKRIRFLYRLQIDRGYQKYLENQPHNELERGARKPHSLAAGQADGGEPPAR